MADPVRSPRHGLPYIVWQHVAICVYPMSYFISMGATVAILAHVVLSQGSVAAIAELVVLVALAVMPLGRVSAFGRWFTRSACEAARTYFPVHVHLEDEEKLRAEQPYVIAYEPHSSLPAALPAVFGTESGMLPAVLRGRCHVLASSVNFSLPIVRHLYWWMGARDASRETARAVLAAKQCLVVIPGGIQEVVKMRHGEEVVFLRSRLGFVRLAMQTGAAILPVYAFGQNRALSYYLLGPPFAPRKAVEQLSRRVGLAPVLMWGKGGTPFPHQVPINVVVGAPISIPFDPNPDSALVQQYLDKYVAAVEALFDKYKDRFGMADKQLLVL